MKTYMANNQTVERKWYVIDAKGQRLGRLSTEVATLLRGKHKPTFTPHVDCGDYVIIINAKNIELTGNKWANKKYYTHSMYPGGLKTTTAKVMNERHPERMVELAIKGMLPHGKLGRQMFKKLYVYEGDTHPHQAQTPQAYELKG
ncbi:MAG: 50S ribosomal protein L13 [Bacillota bacterium]|jgi:large subunit ribosomal protein L13